MGIAVLTMKKDHTEENIGKCTRCDLETQPVMRCRCPERRPDGRWVEEDAEIEAKIDELMNTPFGNQREGRDQAEGILLDMRQSLRDAILFGMGMTKERAIACLPTRIALPDENDPMEWAEDGSCSADGWNSCREKVLSALKEL